MQSGEARLDIARWKQYLKTITTFLAWTVVLFWPFLLTSWLVSGYAKDLNNICLYGLGEVFWYSLFSGMSVGLGISIAFNTYVYPKSLSSQDPGIEGIVPRALLGHGEKHVRGAKLTLGPSYIIVNQAKKDATEASSRIKRPYPIASVTIAGAPFPYRFENLGTFLMGAAGSGKSQIIKQMIYDIRRRGGRDKLIIYDRKPEYTPLFYRRGDQIICPADKRHLPWDIFAEIKGEQDIEGVVKSLIPEMPGTGANDKFWIDSARGVFRAILTYLLTNVRNPSNKDLCQLLFNSAAQPKDLWDKLKTSEATRTLASCLSDADNPRATVPGSVLATLKSYTDSFTRPEIAERGTFSIKQWLHDPETEGQALFLVNPARYSANYKSYYTVILDLALREMISLPNDTDRRVWFFIDEFGSLFRLDSIVRLLAEGRSKGAAVVLGTQDLAQIKQNYKDDTETLVNNCNSKCLSRVTSREEAKYISELIGEMEVEKHDGGSSVQMNEDRGVSMSLNDHSSRRRERRPVVLPAQIMNLESLTYFVKMCEYDWFMNRIPYYDWDAHTVVPEFIERSRSYFDTRKLIVRQPGGRG